MTYTIHAERDGLGVASWIPIVASIAGSIGGALATKYIVGGSPSQKEIEKQMKLQQQLDIQRMLQAEAAETAARERGFEQVQPYILPALGVFALVMLLRR